MIWNGGNMQQELLSEGKNVCVCADEPYILLDHLNTHKHTLWFHPRSHLW